MHTVRRAMASLVALMSGTLPATAIDLLPFDYVPAPAGTTAFLGYYIFGSRSSFDSTLAGRFDDDTGLDTHVFAARVTHWEQIRGVPVAAQVIVPYGVARNGRIAGARLAEPSGFFDPTLTLAFWPIAQPEQRRWLAVANYLSVPLGDFDRGQLSFGENRFRNDLQIGLTQGLEGGFSIDLTADLILYGDNDEGGGGDQTLSQDPTIEAYGWLTWAPDAGSWIGLGYAGGFGGEQQLDGSANGVKTEFHQIRAGYGRFVSPGVQIVGTLGRDLHVEGGFRQDIVAQLRVLKLF